MTPTYEMTLLPTKGEYHLYPNNVNKYLFNFGKIFNYNHQEWLKYVLIKGILKKANYVASNVNEILVEHPI